jgi:DNA repair exonuclease SbcCD ATPase subunit
MRNRIVVWGTNAEDHKVLLAVALEAEENRINIHVIPDRDCTEEFYKKMMSDWREGGELEFPASTQHMVRELSMADSILPDELKVERTDVIQRAQMEWHFAVLTSKLYRNFKNDMEEISDKVKRLEVFDPALWEDMKNLWSNVQKQVMDKNLFKDHIDSLRQKSDAIFEELKKLRDSAKNEAKEKSKEVLDQFMDRIHQLAERLESGAVIKPIFDELVKVQNEIKELAALERSHVRKLKNRLDEVFQQLKAKRESQPGSSPGKIMDQVKSRMEGLSQAIQRLEQSLRGDQRDIDFENKRIASTNGQLEAQIRVAKIKMIEERMRLKQEKLDELNKVREGLEKKQEKFKVKEEKDKQKAEEKKLLKKEEQKIKEKISQEIHQTQETLAAEQEKLLKAAEEIKQGKTPGIQDADGGSEPVLPVPGPTELAEASQEETETFLPETGNAAEAEVPGQEETAASVSAEKDPDDQA